MSSHTTVSSWQKRCFVLLCGLVITSCTLRQPAPIQFQSGGRNADFIAQEWYDNGRQKSLCTWNYQGANALPGGAKVEVKADDEGEGCVVVITFPKSEPGSAATVDALNLSLTQDQLQMLAPLVLGLLRGGQ